MKVEHHGPHRLVLRQNLEWVAYVIFGVMTALSLYIFATSGQDAPQAPLSRRLLVGAIPFTVGTIFAAVMLASMRHVSLDRNAGTVIIRQGWALWQKTRTYPLSAVEGARIVVVRTRDLRHKPGLRPVLLIRDGDQLQDLSLVRFVTNWESNRDVVAVIQSWLAKGRPS